MQPTQELSLTPSGDCVDDPAWVESQQNRWLAFAERRMKATGSERQLTYTEIEELAGMSFWDSRVIMEKVAKQIRQTF